MPTHAITIKNQLTVFVGVYLFLRTVIWSGVLFFTQPAFPMDVLEHLAWGREWQWVYPNHPGLPAWINEALNVLTNGSHLALSITAPISTSLALLAVWLLAGKVVSPRVALVAMVATEGILAYNVLATEFNHNVLQLSVCAWLCYLSYCAFGENNKDVDVLGAKKLLVWFVLGVVAALSLYAKYSAVLFLGAIFIWSLYNRQARQHYKTAGPWLAMAIFILLTLPQIVALINLNFAPLQFALNRTKEAKEWDYHLWYPLNFALAQLGTMLPALLFLVAIKNKKSTLQQNSPVKSNRQEYIFLVAFMPLILALVISAVGGWKLQSMWGSAMLSFIPLWILMFFSSYKLNYKRFNIAGVSLIALTLMAVVIINVASPYWSGRGKRIHYPAEAIGSYVEQQWAAATQQPLLYVVGANHISTLVSHYAPSRPTAIVDGNWHKHPWVSPQDFKRCGGVVVWAIDDGKRNNNPPPNFIELYSPVQQAEPLIVNWQTGADIPPLKIGLFVVLPTESC